MAYTLEQLSADIRHALDADAGPAGKQAVCALVSKVSLDKEFVAQRAIPCKNRSKPAPDFGRKRQVISAESGT